MKKEKQAKQLAKAIILSIASINRSNDSTDWEMVMQNAKPPKGRIIQLNKHQEKYSPTKQL